MPANVKKTDPKFINYSYDEMKQGLQDIIRNMNLEEWQPHAILGLTRGGLFPAVMMSHYFDIKMIPVNLSLRDFKNDFAAVVTELDQTINLDSKTYKNILVVDDILDSGETFAQLKEIFEMIDKFKHFDIKYSTLFYNETNKCKFVPDFYSMKIDKEVEDHWVVFPFESWWKH